MKDFCETCQRHNQDLTTSLIKGIEEKKWKDVGVEDEKKQLKRMKAADTEKLNGLRTFLIDLDLAKHLKGIISDGFDSVRKVKKTSNVKKLIKAGVTNIVEQKKIFAGIDKMGPKMHLVTHISNEEQPSKIQPKKKQNKNNKLILFLIMKIKI